MAPIWSKHPFKGLYTTYCVLAAFVTLPWLLLRYSPKSTRPFPAWNLRYCLLNAIGRDLFTYYAQVRSNGMSDLVSDHSKAEQRYALAEPAETDLYSDVLAPGEATPAPVGGLWYPAPLLAGSSDVKTAKVVLHFPGGGFVRAYGQEYWGKSVSGAVLDFSTANYVFFAQYRLSVDNRTRFPAAMQDVLTFYIYVLRLGVNPKNIIVSGDSAGANLAIGLLRYLEASASSTLPLPRGVMLWSPWVHVTQQAGVDFESNKASKNDCIVPSFLQWGADAYFPKRQLTAEEYAYISPLNHPFHTNVPLFIHAGTAEGFYDRILEFADQMSKVEGNRIRSHLTDFTTHNLIMAYQGLGFERDMEVAMKDAFRFFEL
ncbi:Alpha/Beta hydrolase protein [Xylaria telfairii]|nr:Alpha/Beta hydrolase protein [Xylaria telfairii]